MNSIKVKARNITARAIKLNLITKPSFCLICWEKGKIHAHHQDYNQVLDVDWLCSHCHRKVHDAVRILYSFIVYPSFANPLTGNRHFLTLKV